MQPHTNFNPNKSSSFRKPPFKPQGYLHEILAYDFLIAFIHDITDNHDYTTTDNDVVTEEAPKEVDNDTRLINAMTSSNRKLPPGDIRRVMSNNSTHFVNKMEYYVTSHKTLSPTKFSLVDRGANGGVAGYDEPIVIKTHRTVEIKGIDNHHVNNIDIGTVGGLVHTLQGPMISIMHQYSLLGKGSSIHSPCQMEWYKNDVNDKSFDVPGGLQRIKTPEGYIIPLFVKTA